MFRVPPGHLRGAGTVMEQHPKTRNADRILESLGRITGGDPWKSRTITRRPRLLHGRVGSPFQSA